MNLPNKKLVLIFCLLITTAIKAQWVNINAPSQASGNCIYFASPDTGYMVTAYFPTGGEIWKTTDGNTWTSQLAISDYLFAVHFVTNEIGWAAGGQIGGGVIMKTIDGGINWVVQNNTCEQIMSIYFVNESIGWAVATDGTQGTYFIYHTIDGGSTWTTQQTGTDYVRSVFFINETTGWIAGDNGRIFGTTDAGLTWTLLNTGVGFHFNDIYFISPLIGWSVGSYGNGGCYKTTDGGVTWVQQTLPTIAAMQSVYFVSANEGWISGDNGKLLKTYDGGVTWQQEVSNTTSTLNALYFVNANVGYATGVSGTVIKYSNPVSIKETEQGQELIVRPNPNNGIFEIKLNKTEQVSRTMELELFSIQGSFIKNYTFNNMSATNTIDASNLAPGYYVLKVKTNHGIFTQNISIYH